MRFRGASLPGLLPTAFMAALITAIPTPDPDASLSIDHGDMELFKRASVLEPRNLELAEMHGVNLIEMYKHSVIKRDDGDQIALWVENVYADHVYEDEASKSAKRIGSVAKYKDNSITDWCWDHNRQDHTDPNVPFTGGVKAMYNWATNRRGVFAFGVGTRDVRNDARIIIKDITVSYN